MACECGRSVLPESGVCIGCMSDAGECSCSALVTDDSWPTVAESAVVPPDDAPWPDDPREVARQRRGLRLVDATDRADDDDGTATLDAIPAYPVGALVGPLADFVKWAVKDGLVASAAGAAGLAALATVAGRSELALSGTFIVRPALWVAPVGNTGTGKSPALDQAFAAVSALYDAERTVYDAECEAADAAGEKCEAIRPRPPTLGDVTMPSVARWLKQTGGSGCLVYDELAAMLAAFAKDGSDRAKLCEMWTARRPVHIQRVGAGGSTNEVDIYVSRPVLSVVGPLTPDTTKELGKEGDGFRARWLVHIIDGQAQLLDAGKQPGSWTSAIAALYGARDQTRRWHLTGRARTLYEVACQRWRVAQTEALPQSVIEALRKADIQCARIALVLAESASTDDMRQWATDDRGTIPAEVVESAIAITDYVMACWQALPGAAVLTLSMAEEKLSGAADELFSWLETRPKSAEGLPDGEAPRACATRREIMRARVGGAVTAPMVSAMLAAYDARWPGNVVQIEQGGKGGGRVRVLYYFPKRASGPAGANIDVTVTSIGAAGFSETGAAGAGRRDAGGDIDVTGSMSQPLCDIDPVTSIRGECDTDPAATDRAEVERGPVVCDLCGGDLDPALVALGMTNHGEDGPTE